MSFFWILLWSLVCKCRHRQFFTWRILLKWHVQFAPCCFLFQHSSTWKIATYANNRWPDAADEMNLHLRCGKFLLGINNLAKSSKNKNKNEKETQIKLLASSLFRFRTRSLFLIELKLCTLVCFHPTLNKFRITIPFSYTYNFFR